MDVFFAKHMCKESTGQESYVVCIFWFMDSSGPLEDLDVSNAQEANFWEFMWPF